MKEKELALNPNPLVNFLKKSPDEFSKEDLIKYIGENQIQMLNFRYTGEDGRLKTLNFVINNKKQLDTLLSTGERVDGSSLFSYIEAGSSDLYVVPRYKTAFLNPFTEIPTLDILCSYFDKDGNLLTTAPENIMNNAHKALVDNTGFSLHAMGELEYYAISERMDLFPAKDQKGYHECFPFTKWGDLRTEAMQLIAQCGGSIKYGHSEVGNFSDENHYYEQNELEFLPVSLEDAANQLIISKWILRMLGLKYGICISYAPKITVGKAGSGLHIHMRLMKDGKTATIENGKLSDHAQKAIAGILDISPSLTAFGNTVPISYLRLVPHQEAPTYVCWGDRNRSALIRVPLGWTGDAGNMIKKANHNYKGEIKDYSSKQTYEFRVADGSADIYLLLAGLAVGTRHGLEMQDSLKKAEELYAAGNIFHDEFKDKLSRLKQLPASCAQSADKILEQKSIYTKYDVFTEGMIHRVAEKLREFNDENLSEQLFGKEEEIKNLVNSYLHCM